MSATDPDARTLDGNAIAGVLAEVFNDADMTSATRLCSSCGQRLPIGRYRLYRGAGMVLRCPSCDDVALTLVEGDGWHEVRMTGWWSVRVPAKQ